jgi:DNA-binding transcriptional regulator YiaG
MTKFMKLDCREADGPPLHYKACGLDDVYLVNGWSCETIDGEEYLTVEDLDGLWKAIGLHLVTERKVLKPKELRFLREHMQMTQAELAIKLRVSDQSVARWEKGETECSGPADFMIRILFLSSECAQPEGERELADIRELVDEIIKNDEPETQQTTFRHSRHKWKEERVAAYA